MSEAGWLALAVAAVAAGIGGYLASIVVRRNNLESRLEQAKKRTSRSAP